MTKKLGRPAKTQAQRTMERNMWRARCRLMGRTFPPLNAKGNIPDWTLTRLRAAWEDHLANLPRQRISGGSQGDP